MLTEFPLVPAKLFAAVRTFVVPKVRDQAGKCNNQADDQKRVAVVPQQHDDNPDEHQYVAELLRFS